MDNKKINLDAVPPIILASASPRREMLLKEAGLKFRVVPSSLSEPEHNHLTPEEQALYHAFRKASAISKIFPDCLVIGADTVVCIGAKLYGKPENIKEARVFLKELSGKTHQVITGVCLKCLKKNWNDLFSETTEVDFYDLDDEKIGLYLSKVNPMDKAGAYGIQESGELIVKQIRGSYTNVVGLPMEKLLEKLSNLIHRKSQFT